MYEFAYTFLKKMNHCTGKQINVFFLLHALQN